MTTSEQENMLEQRIDRLEKRVAELEGTVVTHIGVVQDKSTSMAGREEATISGFNEYIEDLANKAEGSNVSYRVTLVQFNTNHHVCYIDKAIKDVAKLDQKSYVVGGSTALFDAIDKTADIIHEQMEPGDNALILVMTDGEENSSRKVRSKREVQGLIKGKEETGNWTFVFLGADVNSFAAVSYGFASGNVLRYANNTEGITGTYSSLSGATHAHSVRGGSSRTFVTDHLNKDLTDPLSNEDENE